MPELPDILYITKRLSSWLPGKTILSVRLKDPVVLRQMVAGDFTELLRGKKFGEVRFSGPFFRFDLEEFKLVINLMLAGRFQRQEKGQKTVPEVCLAFELDDGTTLNYADQKRMGKVYLAREENFGQIPGYLNQGIDILGPDFTYERFKASMGRSRRQVRVFLLDQTALSAIGNAYADEILFRAGLHPKTPCSALGDEEARRLFESVRETIAWGVAEVEKASEPIEVKVRGHVKVRNRKGEPCPVCGTTIQRASVLGYDAFFCPRCQPARGKQFIPW